MTFDLNKKVHGKIAYGEYFVILGTMRTGSNLLQSYLNQYSDILCLGELFNPSFVGIDKPDQEPFLAPGYKRGDVNKRDKDIFTFFNRVYDCAVEKNCFGFRFFPKHNNIILNAILSNLNSKKVLLKRNPVESYVSLLIAFETNNWVSNKPNNTLSQKVHFKKKGFLDFLEERDEFYKFCEGKLRQTSQEVFLIDYESLTNVKKINELASFLGSQIQLKKLVENVHKVSTKILRDKVDNYDEMLSFLSKINLSDGLTQNKSSVISAGLQKNIKKPRILSSGGSNVTNIPEVSFREVITHRGIKLPLFNFISPSIEKAIRQGSYEATEASQINNIIQNNERVLEIGSGIGFISTLVLKNPKTIDYLGFEANPILIEAIQNVFTQNKVNGRVENAILTHDPEVNEMSFYLRKDFWASSLDEKPWGYEKVIKVKSVLFNQKIDEFKPTMIICDIEGGELNLLRDACLIGVKKVYLEIHQQVLGRRGVRKLFDIMSSKGFHYDQWHSSGSVILFSHIDR